MTAATSKIVNPAPPWWWLVVAGIWFSTLSLTALWLIDITILPGAPNKLTSDTFAKLTVAAATFIAGALCWWTETRKASRFASAGTSIGIGTAILSLLINPYAWLISVSSFFLFPLVLGVVIVLGGIGLRLVFLTIYKVWPNHTVERNARNSGARPSP